MKITKRMQKMLNWLNQGCDQDELDKRSINALIARGIVFRDVHHGWIYKPTVKGEIAYMTDYADFTII